MSIAKLLDTHKPDRVSVNKPSFEAIFEIKGKKLKVDLKTDKNVAEIVSILSNSKNVVQLDVDTPGEVKATMNWEESVFASKQEQDFDEIEEDAKRRAMESASIFRSIDKIITDASAIEAVISSSGTVIFDGVVSNKTISGDLARNLYVENSRNEKNAVGNIKDLTIEVQSRKYLVSMWKVGEELSVKFSRVYSDLDRLSLVLPTEMKYRFGQLKSGLIITSMNSIINLEHAIPIFRELDENFLKLACTVGDNFITTKLPTIPSINAIRDLKKTQYKYVIVSEVKKREHLDMILELAYLGKTIIIGFENDSVYANLINLISLCENNDFMVSKTLMSTIGFIHPIVGLKKGLLSLENSECVTLSNTKTRRIIEGDLLSKESFNLLIERPSKVFSLGTKGVFMSQEEELNDLLRQAIKQGASDIHLVVGTTPMFRVQGSLVPVDQSSNPIKLKPEMLEHIVSLLVTTEAQKQALDEENDLQMPYSVSGVGRFRVQISSQRGTKYIAIRHTALKIPSAEAMGIPEQVIQAIKNNPKGLILITGPTGSGKSTTTAIMIDILKDHGCYNILSLADPIEFIHSHGKGIVTQREIPSDVRSYEKGMYSAFRSDPDIIEVQEMRSTESVENVLRSANSGHLVITTYHTSSVIGTFDALKNKLPQDKHGELINTMAQNSVVIMNQMLIEGLDGKRVPVFEYLIPNRQIRNAIMAQDWNSIKSQMKTSGQGLRDVATWADFEVLALYKQKRISLEVAKKYIVDKEVVKHLGGN